MRCTPAEVVAQLTAAPLTVAVLGFSPGFAYLDGLPAALPPGAAAGASRGQWSRPARSHWPTATPRCTPWPRRVAGSSSGAPRTRSSRRTRRTRCWRRGTGCTSPWRRTASPPTRCPWGPRRGRRPPAPGPCSKWWRPACAPSGRTAGRHDVAAAGIPGAAPADPVSFALANQLVGNGVGATALELTGGGIRLRVLGRLPRGVGRVPTPRSAWTRWRCRAARCCRSRPGQVLDGRRARGAVVAPISPWPADCSARRRSAAWPATSCAVSGPGPSAPGETLWAGPWEPPLGDHLLAGAASELDPAERVTLRVVPGPHAERFRPDALDTLAETVFTVGPDSNRVGHTPAGPRGRATAAARRRGRGRARLPMRGHRRRAGAAGGRAGRPAARTTPRSGATPSWPSWPRPTTGGSGSARRARAVRLVPVSADEAEEARQATRRAQASAVVGHYPLRAG